MPGTVRLWHQRKDRVRAVDRRVPRRRPARRAAGHRDRRRPVDPQRLPPRLAAVPDHARACPTALAGYHDVRSYPDAAQLPGLVIYRFDAPLFFANAKSFRDEILRLARRGPAAAVDRRRRRADHRRRHDRGRRAVRPGPPARRARADPGVRRAQGPGAPQDRALRADRRDRAAALLPDGRGRRRRLPRPDRRARGRRPRPAHRAPPDARRPSPAPSDRGRPDRRRPASPAVAVSAARRRSWTRLRRPTDRRPIASAHSAAQSSRPRGGRMPGRSRGSRTRSAPGGRCSAPGWPGAPSPRRCRPGSRSRRRSPRTSWASAPAARAVAPLQQPDRLPGGVHPDGDHAEHAAVQPGPPSHAGEVGRPRRGCC